jgi:hypothetical protein
MIESYLTTGNYQVTKAPVSLFDGTITGGAITLTGAWPTGRTGRCKVTISSVSGHTDCAGSIVLGSETLTFTIAGTKTTTVSLTANPVASSANLDCHCHITVIDSGGADITSETLTAIDSRIDVKQSGFYNASGTWTKTDNVIYSNSSLNLGDTVRSNTTDYIVKKKDAYTDIGGTVEFYTYLA